MKFLTLCSLVTALVLTLPGQTLFADVGACWIMFAYHHKVPLNAKQQKELGSRLLDAHVGSSESDGHILFMCEIDTHDSDEPKALYRIRETYADVGHKLNGFRLSAPDFKGLQQAVREVEQASKQNSINGLKAGARTKVMSEPLYKNK